MQSLSRKTDPFTSAVAAEEVDRKGVAAHQRQVCLDAVKMWPGHTSQELFDLIQKRWPTRLKVSAIRTGLPTCRRLPELDTLKLIRRGEARKCEISGRECITWWPINRLF